MTEKQEIMLVDEQTLKDKIYIIRGQQVMLDVDLAKIYGYTTKAFNQQVRRNIERFPGDFMFKLTKEEVEQNLRLQKVTLDVGQYSKYLPNAFTESGIYMLMTVLNHCRHKNCTKIKTMGNFSLLKSLKFPMALISVQ